MENITCLKPYKFTVGEKVNIASGPLRGDWLVIRVDEKSVALQCPVSKKKINWKDTCFEISRNIQTWPQY